MKYLNRLGLILSAIILLTGAIAIMPSTASAQRRIVRRPVIVRQYDPFWRGTLWDPYWGRGYWNDPYYWDMREDYYNKKAASDAQRKLKKDREKYGADGYIDPKEAEKLAKDQQKLSKAVDKLNKY